MISILCHIYHTQTWPEISSYLRKIPLKKRLYVNLVENRPNIREVAKEIRDLYPESTILISPNQGKDCGGNLRLMDKWMLDGSPNPFIIQIHTKSNPGWRHELIDPLLNNVEDYLSYIFHNDDVGMAGCKKWLYNREGDVNSTYYNEYCRKFNFNTKKPMTFIGGTMFCVRSHIFKKFFSEFNPLKLAEQLEYGDVNEPSRTHAWERLFGGIVSQSGYTLQPIDFSSLLLKEFDEKFYLEYYSDVRNAIAKREMENAFVHFMSNGRLEGRRMNKLVFDEDYYFTTHPDVKKHMIEKGWPRNAYQHFITYGFREKRDFRWIK